MYFVKNISINNKNISNNYIRYITKLLENISDANNCEILKNN